MKVLTTMLGDKRVGHFVEGKTLDTDATVQEAINAGYVIGKKELVVSAVSGVVRSMVAGVSKDGNGRKIDEVVSLQPSLRCKLADNCEPVTKDNVEAKLRARVLKDGKIDTSDWSFTVEGSTSSMVINSITTGELVDVVTCGEAIDFNVTNLGEVASDANIKWVATKADGTTETATVLLSACTVSANRITTGTTVLSPIASSEWDDCALVFTLTNGSAKAIKSVAYKFAF